MDSLPQFLQNHPIYEGTMSSAISIGGQMPFKPTDVAREVQNTAHVGNETIG